MKKLLSKLVRLSKPMKVADNNEDTNLPFYIINDGYERINGTGPRSHTHQVNKVSVDEMPVDEMAWRRENL